jgi:hypothetical protein
MSKENIEIISSSQMISEVKKSVNNIILSDSIEDAKKLYYVLKRVFDNNPDFEEIDKELYKLYYYFFISLKFVIIFDLEEDEIVNLISNKFGFVLRHPDYDLDTKLRYKIKSMYGAEARDSFKKRIRQALLECKTHLGKEKIIINNQYHEATIANWLKDYYVKVGIKKVDAIVLNEYLVKNKNINLLTPEEKHQLKKILMIFENMKVLSSENPMYEENFVAILPDNEIALIDHMGINKLDPKINKLFEEIKEIEKTETPSDQLTQLKAMANQYAPGSLERMAVEEEIGKLESGIRN